MVHGSARSHLLQMYHVIYVKFSKFYKCLNFIRDKIAALLAVPKVSNVKKTLLYTQMWKAHSLVSSSTGLADGLKIFAA
jgi:hypothetical protein